MSWSDGAYQQPGVTGDLAADWSPRVGVPDISLDAPEHHVRPARQNYVTGEVIRERDHLSEQDRVSPNVPAP